MTIRAEKGALALLRATKGLTIDRSRVRIQTRLNGKTFKAIVPKTIFNAERQILDRAAVFRINELLQDVRRAMEADDFDQKSYLAKLAGESQPGELLDAVKLELARRDMKSNSIDAYTGIINHWIKPYFGHLRFVDLSDDVLQPILMRFDVDSAERINNDRRAMTLAFIRKALANARANCEYCRAGAAILKHHQSTNPKYYLTEKKVEVDPDTVLSDEERTAIMRGQIDRWEDDLLFAQFLLASGCRPSEVAALTWDDVDLFASTVTVKRTIVSRKCKAGRIICNTPKSNRSRVVRLEGQGMKVLQRLRFKYPEDILSDYSDNGLPAQGAFVFRCSTGKLQAEAPCYFRDHAWPAIKADLGIRDIPPRNLRTTYGSALWTRTSQPQLVSAQLGHARMETTQRHYARFDTEHAEINLGF